MGGAGAASVLNANAAGAAGVAGLLAGGGAVAAPGGQQDVKARKLYVGNLPLDLNVTELTMKEFFDTAMLAAFPELAETLGKPVEQVWMSGEKKFCFVTFRNELEAEKGMQLDNIQLMGRPLRIGRPSDYVPPAGGVVQQPPLGATGTNQMLLGAGAPAAGGAPGGATSVVLRLTNTMTEAEVDDEEEYNVSVKPPIFTMKSITLVYFGLLWTEFGLCCAGYQGRHAGGMQQSRSGPEPDNAEDWPG